jgi:hypothetical protein
MRFSLTPAGLNIRDQVKRLSALPEQALSFQERCLWVSPMKTARASMLRLFWLWILLLATCFHQEMFEFCPLFGFLSDFGDIENGLMYCAISTRKTHTVNREHAYAARIHCFRR